jgi:hypothetical protein
MGSGPSAEGHASVVCTRLGDVRALPGGPTGRWYRAVVFGGRFIGATGCVLLVASVLAVPGSAGVPELRWRPLLHVPTIVDVVGPRADGQLVLSTRRGLLLVRPGRPATEFARGPAGYVAAGGEPYIALAPARRLPNARCSFKRDDVFALDTDSTPGVVRIGRTGQAVRLIDFPADAFPSGIAFDLVGRFGYRLLVTAVVAGKTTLYAIDCLGGRTVVARDAPRVEGGIAVAPSSFGRFGGDLIAPDEHSGRILAFSPTGAVQLVAKSRVAAGADIGVEGVGFVPSGFSRTGSAYFSDLGAPGSPTEGTDSLLALGGSDLVRAGVRAGDLVAATEAGARTISVRCTRRCTVRRIGEGPAATHGEGHITFVR